jgi:hypothetical protein
MALRKSLIWLGQLMGRLLRRELSPRCVGAWVIALLAMCVACWWCFYYPFSLSRLHGALPLGSVAVTQHDGVGDRWPELLASPELTHALDVFGDGSEVLETLRNPAVVRLIAALGDRPVFTSYVPRLGVSQRPAWVAVGWCGGFSQLLRFGWLDGVLAGMSPCELRGAARGWRSIISSGEDSPPVVLGIVVLEGVVAAVCSEDPAAMLELAARLRLRGMGQLAYLTNALESGEESAAPDRLIGSPACSLPGLPDVWLKRAELPCFGPDGIELTAALGTPRLGPLDSLPEPSLVGRLPANLASLRVTAPVANLLTLSRVYLPVEQRGVVEALTSLVDTHQSGLVAIGSPHYPGHLFRLPVPAAVVALPLSRGARDDFDGTLQALTDRLNSRYQLGVMVSAPNPRSGIRSVAPVRSQSLSLPGLSSWCFVGVSDGWLLASSDEGVLARVMGHLRGGAGPATSVASEPTAAEIVLNGEECAWAIQRLLVFARLYARFSKEGGQDAEKWMTELAQTAEFLQKTPYARLSAVPLAEGVELTLRTTRAPSSR